MTSSGPIKIFAGWQFITLPPKKLLENHFCVFLRNFWNKKFSYFPRKFAYGPLGKKNPKNVPKLRGIDFAAFSGHGCQVFNPSGPPLNQQQISILCSLPVSGLVNSSCPCVRFCNFLSFIVSIHFHYKISLTSSHKTFPAPPLKQIFD